MVGRECVGSPSMTLGVPWCPRAKVCTFDFTKVQRWNIDIQAGALELERFTSDTLVVCLFF